MQSVPLKIWASNFCGVNSICKMWFSRAWCHDASWQGVERVGQQTTNNIPTNPSQSFPQFTLTSTTIKSWCKNDCNILSCHSTGYRYISAYSVETIFSKNLKFYAFMTLPANLVLSEWSWGLIKHGIVTKNQNCHNGHNLMWTAKKLSFRSFNFVATPAACLWLSSLHLWRPCIMIILSVRMMMNRNCQ